jgi:hypothetical protein
MVLNKTNRLKLKTRTLVTFENKSIKKDGGIDTDPTTATFPPTIGMFPFDLFMQVAKKD